MCNVGLISSRNVAVFDAGRYLAPRNGERDVLVVRDTVAVRLELGLNLFPNLFLGVKNIRRLPWKEEVAVGCQARYFLIGVIASPLSVDHVRVAECSKKCRKIMLETSATPLFDHATHSQSH